jgi:hypothetical protein
MSVKGTNSLDNLFDFLDESKKSLTQTRLEFSRRHVMGEAKALVLEFCEMLVSYE